MTGDAVQRKKKLPENIQKALSTGSETRTQTPVKATDFESVVSTISPTRHVVKVYQKRREKDKRFVL